MNTTALQVLVLPQTTQDGSTADATRYSTAGPARAGVGPIGHMGHFRGQAAPLEYQALNRLDGHGASARGPAPQAAN